jgi:hypothetical protein
VTINELPMALKHAPSGPLLLLVVMAIVSPGCTVKNCVPLSGNA